MVLVSIEKKEAREEETRHTYSGKSPDSYGMQLLEDKQVVQSVENSVARFTIKRIDPRPTRSCESATRRLPL